MIKEIFIKAPIRLLGKQVEQRHFTREPILIVACPRSGTTLLLSILSAVPAIFAVPNQTYAFDRWEKDKNSKWRPTLLHRLYREFLKNKIPASANRWLEKTPGHVRSMDKILAYFNNRVKIIHIIRDGRDVTVSSHPAYLDKRKYWVPAERWVQEVTFGLRFKDHPSVYTLRYEDLISDYEKEIRKILVFIDEPYTEDVINWIQHTHIKNSKHWGEGVKQIHSQAIGKWKKPEHQERIQEFFNNKEAIQLMHQLGYS